MSCRGVHFAIDPGAMRRLLEAKSDEAVVDIAVSQSNEQLDTGWYNALDKAWDALHRCLADGTLTIPKTFSPLAAAVLGGEQLHSKNSWIISLVRPEDVRAVADALRPLTRQWLRARYDAIDPRDYDGEMGDEDFEYTWDGFKTLPDLFERAARAGRAMVFLVDL